MIDLSNTEEPAKDDEMWPVLVELWQVMYPETDPASAREVGDHFALYLHGLDEKIKDLEQELALARNDVATLRAAQRPA